MFAFANHDEFEHAVERTETRRRSLAVFFYRVEPGYEGRTSADFAKPQPRCKHCGGETQFKLVERHARFYSCAACGCDSSDLRYADIAWVYAGDCYKHHYNRPYIELLNEVNTNVAFILQSNPPEKTALDVGCLDGATLCRLHSEGWDVHGWDVNPTIPGYVESQSGIPAERITIGKEFQFDGRRYGAVISREVIEHVDDHRAHFAELAKSVLPGGILHLQTPRPHDDPDDRIIYQCGHLQVLSPAAIEELFLAHGLSTEHKLLWDRGQAWLARKPA